MIETTQGNGQYRSVFPLQNEDTFQLHEAKVKADFKRVPYSIQKSSSQATTTVTSTYEAFSALQTNPQGLFTNYTIAEPVNIAALHLDCPSIDGTSHTSSIGCVYSISCQVGYTASDIAVVRAYKVEDCMEACDGLNAFQDERVCALVYFHAFMSEVDLVPYGNCWLKSSDAETFAQGPDSFEPLNQAASAQIVRCN